MWAKTPQNQLIGNLGFMGKMIFEEFITFASGKKTKSEILNLGRHEFAPSQIGITG